MTATRPTPDGADPPLLRFVRRIAARHTLSSEPDGELCARYALVRDEAAFAELVRRHGGMVYGVCRRTLGHDADAEDASQAAFLVLARRAASLAGRPTVGDWLHGVARRTALKLRSKRARRRAVEAASARPAVMTPEGAHDTQAAVDRAVTALPAKLRRAVVLCELQGLSRAEASARLGIHPGTLASRLAAARVKLRRRLGPLAPAIVLATAGAPHLPARAAAILNHCAAGACPAAVTVLATEVIRVMTIAKLKTLLAAGLLATGLAASGVAVSRGTGPDDKPAAPVKPDAPKPPEPPKAPEAKPTPDAKSPAPAGSGSLTTGKALVARSRIVDGQTVIEYGVEDAADSLGLPRDTFLAVERGNLVGRYKVIAVDLHGTDHSDISDYDGIPREFKFGTAAYDSHNQFERQMTTISVRERTFARGLVTKTETFNTAINPHRTPHELTLITGEPGSGRLMPFIYEHHGGNKLRLATYHAVGEVDRPRSFEPKDQPAKTPPLLRLELERVDDPVKLLTVDGDGNLIGR